MSIAFMNSCCDRNPTGVDLQGLLKLFNSDNVTRQV